MVLLVSNDHIHFTLDHLKLVSVTLVFEQQQKMHPHPLRTAILVHLSIYYLE